MFQHLFQKSNKRRNDMAQTIDFIGGEYRNRTGVHGFAIRCVTTPPTRQSERLIRRLDDARQAVNGCANVHRMWQYFARSAHC